MSAFDPRLRPSSLLRTRNRRRWVDQRREPKLLRRLRMEPLEQRCLLDVGSAAASGCDGGFAFGSHQPALLETLAVASASAVEGDRDLVYMGVDRLPQAATNPGLLLIADPAMDLTAPWHAPASNPGAGFRVDEGITGLAFVPLEGLWASTFSSSLGQSWLLGIDPDSDGIQSRQPITHLGQPLAIGDLAVEPGQGTLVGIGCAGAALGQLYQIDPATGSASWYAGTPSELAVRGLGDALAFDGNTLYAAGTDPVDGSAWLFVESSSGSGFVALDRPINGMTVRPHDGALIGSLVEGDAGGDALVVIDVATGATRTVHSTPPGHGTIGDVAFRHESTPVGLKTVHHADFETGLAGYVADNSGGANVGLWHHSLGRRLDGLPGHTPSHNWYYGAFETSYGRGHYVANENHKGTLTSPEISIPDCGTTIVSFSYLLGTRPAPDVDFVEVIVVDEAGHHNIILSRAAGNLPETQGAWTTATYDLSDYAGQAVSIEFFFDTRTLVEIDPEGWYIDDVMVVNLCPTEPNLTGYKWNDSDGDHEWDAGEPGLQGWSLHAYVDQNHNFRLDQDEFDPGPAATATTDVQGQYEMWLLPGDFIIVEELKEAVPPGDPWEQTFPCVPVLAAGLNPGSLASGGYPVTLGQGDQIHGSSGAAELPNFGNWNDPAHDEPATISGYKWNDLDADGEWDAGEPGLNGWTIYIDENLNGQPDVGERATVTANDGTHDGAYLFENLDPGAYTIREIVPAGWGQTYPDDPDFEHVVTVVSGQEFRGGFGVAEPPNFGNHQPPESPEIALDFGDAPERLTDGSGYPTLRATGGARHRIVDGLYLGVAAPDAEPDGQPEPNAKGDDGDTDSGNTGPNWHDERGVRFLSPLVPGQPAEIEVTVTNRSGSEAFVNAWIDFNADGDWDDTFNGIGEHVLVDVPVPEVKLGSTTYQFTIVVPEEAAAGATFVRVRLSTTEGLSYSDPAAMPDEEAPDGEVEDHRVFIDLINTTTVQFITPLSLFRTDGPFVRPPASQIAVAGYVWHDEDGDGAWDAGEPGLNGVTVYVDLNDNDQRDAGEPAFPTTHDGSNDGAFWFGTAQFLGGLPGTFTLRAEVPDDIQSFPGGPDFQHRVSLPEEVDDDTRVIGEFETAEPPNFGIATDFVNDPPNDKGTIIGYKWHDLNQNGQWDTDEPERAGWLVYIDLDNNDVFDPDEPSSITDAEGRYVFPDLVPGDYTLREDTTDLSDGTFVVQRFPTHGEIVVNVVGGSVVEGERGVAESPNFGSFEYSPYVRPADRPPENWLSHSDWLTLKTALRPWQSFTINNPTGKTLTIASIDAVVGPVCDHLVEIWTDEGMRVEPEDFPREMEAGDGPLTFFAFYKPDAPDWQDDPDTPRNEEAIPPHTFSGDDHLEIVTDLDGGTNFRVRLVGASTFDSDIFYDGVVNRRDLEELNEVLSRKTPTRPGDLGWDPTSDINVHDPNGAGMMPEIGLGDLGPLNVEFNRVRAPFLDLNVDNDSGVRGVDVVRKLGTDSEQDASLANFEEFLLDSMKVELNNAMDASEGWLSYDGKQGPSVVISGLGSIDIYESALQNVRYTNSVTDPNPTPRVIAFQAKGDQGFQYDIDGDGTDDVYQQDGNVPHTILIIAASGDGTVLAAEAAQIEQPAMSAAGAGPFAPAVDAALFESNEGTSGNTGSELVLSQEAVDVILGLSAHGECDQAEGPGIAAKKNFLTEIGFLTDDGS